MTKWDMTLKESSDTIFLHRFRHSDLPCHLMNDLDVRVEDEFTSELVVADEALEHHVNRFILTFCFSGSQIVWKFEDFLRPWCFILMMMIGRIDMQFVRSFVCERLLAIRTKILLKFCKFWSEWLLFWGIDQWLRSGEWLRMNRLIHLQVFLHVVQLNHLRVHSNESAQRTLDDVTGIFSSEFFHDLSFDQGFARLELLRDRRRLCGRISLRLSWFHHFQWMD